MEQRTKQHTCQAGTKEARTHYAQVVTAIGLLLLYLHRKTNGRLVWHRLLGLESKQFCFCICTTNEDVLSPSAQAVLGCQEVRIICLVLL